MSGCGGLADPPLGGGVSDPALSGALPADPASTGAVVAETEIDVTLGAGQGIAGAKGDQGDSGPAGPAGATPQESSYPVAVVARQVVIPISPPPTDLNGLQLTINGVAYGPPNSIAVSLVAVTWLGAFPLDPSDDVRVRYF